jgi:hypothetical protein
MSNSHHPVSRRSFMGVAAGVCAAALLPIKSLGMFAKVPVVETLPLHDRDLKAFALKIRDGVQSQSALRRCLMIDPIKQATSASYEIKEYDQIVFIRQKVGHNLLVVSFAGAPAFNGKKRVTIPTGEHPFSCEYSNAGLKKAIAHYKQLEEGMLVRMLPHAASLFSMVPKAYFTFTNEFFCAQPTRANLHAAFDFVEQQDRCVHNIVCNKNGVDWLKTAHGPLDNLGENDGPSVYTADVKEIDAKELDHRIYFLGNPDTIGVMPIKQDIHIAQNADGKSIDAFYEIGCALRFGEGIGYLNI